MKFKRCTIKNKRVFAKEMQPFYFEMDIQENQLSWKVHFKPKVFETSLSVVFKRQKIINKFLANGSKGKFANTQSKGHNLAIFRVWELFGDKS